MAKVVVGENGVVVNVWAPYDGRPLERNEWVVPDDHVVSVGDPFDKKDQQVDGIDVAIFRALHNINNRVRALEGQPPLTLAQAREAFKTLIP